MKISKENVLSTAALAQLSLSDAQTEMFTKELTDLLAFADIIVEADTNGVAPTNYITTNSNVFRDDVIEPSYERDVLLSCAPSKSAGCYTVPEVRA